MGFLSEQSQRDWEEAYSAGYEAGLRAARRDIGRDFGKSSIATVEKRDHASRRKPNAYNAKYSKAFKKVQGKYKKKNGSWVKDGFKKAQKAAHKLAKKM